MKIVGLQKLTLLDYPGKVACTVFLGGCNFRCPYCHNSELLDTDTPSVMDDNALLSFLEKRKGILEGVCITGGEPTLYPELPGLLRAIRTLDYSIKLDTNGYQPSVLEELVRQGLVDYVAMDIKNSPELYAATVGRSTLDLEKLEQSIRFLLTNAVDYEFRTTVTEPFHHLESIRSMGQWLEKLSSGTRIKRLYLQPFVDRETVPVSGLNAPSSEQLAAFFEILSPIAEHVEIRGI